MRMLITTALVFAQCSLLLTGCGNRDASTDTTVTAPQTALSPPAARGYDVAHDLRRGKAVFTSKCLACHGQERSGAPQLGSAVDWEPRLQQPLDTLIQHAIQGHGRMPPKGGFRSITDTDVAAAVAYVVNRSKRIVASVHRQRQASTGCQINQTCGDIDTQEMQTLHMFWLLGNASTR